MSITIRIKRTIVHEFTASYPEQYPGMTLEEALQIEANAHDAEAFDTLSMHFDDQPNDVEITFTTEVTAGEQSTMSGGME